MSNKRVLIVDNDKDLLRLMLHYTLKTLGPDYEIVTATDAPSALDLIEREQFALVLTDYMMPGMTGVDLAQAIRHISPNTQVVLMTAYGTNRLRDTTKYLGLDGYLDKPFRLERIQEVVKKAIERTNPEEKPQLDRQMTDKAVFEELRSLQINAAVRSVLLINPEGYLVHKVGQTDNFEATSVSALVAANFLAASELAKLLGNQAVFKSSYYEGSNYNIYAYKVSDKLLLVVVFDAKQKPGPVWFYTKQTVANLIQLLNL